MAYRYSTIFWPCFIFVTLHKLSNAAIPPREGCDNPMTIEFFNLHSQSPSDVPANITVDLYQVNTEDDSREFLIWDGERSLLRFQAKDVTFQLMSGSTFKIGVQADPSNKYSITGKFKYFCDFENFHSLVNEDSRCSPKNYAIERVESVRCPKDSKHFCVQMLYPGQEPAASPAVLSQYSIDPKLADSDAGVFVIEEAFVEKPTKAYLQLELNSFKYSRQPIGAQVLLSRNERSENEFKYHVVRFDTSENAENFIQYISNFAPELDSPVPRALEVFLGKRT